MRNAVWTAGASFRTAHGLIATLVVTVAGATLFDAALLAQNRGRGGQQRTPPTPTPENANIIRGRVTSREGGPIRGAEVRVADGAGRDARLATTNERGEYELRDIGRGSWVVTASKSGFITQAYGQERAFAPPRLLTTGQRERVDANFVLRRAGAIGGRVFDVFGDPVAGARVQVLRARMNRGRRTLVPTGLVDSTDDTGAYRLYALPAGDYFIGAMPARDAPAVAALSSTNGGAVADNSIINADRVVMTGNVIIADGRGVSTAAGSGTPTYYPGTASIDEAQRVRLSAGDEQMNLNFSLLPVRRVRVSGTVLSSRGPADDAIVNLLSATDLTVSGAPSSNGTMTQGIGQFSMVNVSPGSYYIHARVGTLGPMAPSSEEGLMPLVIGDEDVSGLTVTTAPAGIVEGRIVTESGAPPPVGISVRFEGTLTNTSFGFNTTTTPVNMAPNTFRMPLIAGGFIVNVTPPDGWMVQAVEIGERDVTNTAVELPNGSNYTGRIVLTDRLTRVSGTVRASGRPTPATVIVFPEDQLLWSYPARHVATTEAKEDGTFELRGLPVYDRYLAVALDYLDDATRQDPEALERLRAEARAFALDIGETRTIDLVVPGR